MRCRHYRTASKARHSTAQSTRTSSKTGTRPSERDNASKQTELAGARMSSSIYTARCVLKTNEEIEICPRARTSSSIYSARCVLKTNEETEIVQFAGVMRQGFACTLLMLSVRSISSMNAASALISRTMELLTFASREFEPKPWTSLSASFICICSILPCDQA